MEGDLRPALDLESADRLAPRDLLVGGGIVGRQPVHLGPPTGAALDHVERAAHERQPAQSEEVELGDADQSRSLVELDDGPAHGGVLDREPVAQRLGGEHEAAHVGGAEPGEVVAALHDGEHGAAAGVVEREAELPGQRVAHVLGPFGGLVAVDPLGELERKLGGVAQDAHGVEERVGRAVVLHGAGDGGAGAVPAAVGVVEQLLPPVVLDVEVDVGRLGLPVHPHLGEEALEQEPVAHGVHRGDAETVGDGGVGGAAAALAEDAQRAGLADDVPHHEEEPREPEPADDAQLVLELAALGVGQEPPALARPLLDAKPEERVVGVAVGHGEAGQRGPHPRQVEAAALRDRGRGLEALGARRPAAGHLLGREKPPAAVGEEHAPPGRLREREVGPECGEHVVHQPALPVHVARVLGDDPGHAERVGQVHQQIGELGLVRAGLVALDLDGQTIAEDLAPFREPAKGVGPVPAADERRELARGGAGERDQPLAPLGDQAPGYGRAPTLGVGMLAGPGAAGSPRGRG